MQKGKKQNKTEYIKKKQYSNLQVKLSRNKVIISSQFKI